MADNLLIAIISVLPATIASIASLIIAFKNTGKIEEVHKATNSMKDALVAAALIEGKNLGVAEERAAQMKSET